MCHAAVGVDKTPFGLGRICWNSSSRPVFSKIGKFLKIWKIGENLMRIGPWVKLNPIRPIRPIHQIHPTWSTVLHTAIHHCRLESFAWNPRNWMNFYEKTPCFLVGGADTKPSATADSPISPKIWGFIQWGDHQPRSWSEYIPFFPPTSVDKSPADEVSTEVVLRRHVIWNPKWSKL